MSLPGKQKIVLIGCGTYNPPTLMHLRMFELARDYFKKQLGVSEVEAIISPVNNDYRKLTAKYVEDAAHRLKMVGLSLKPLNNKQPWIKLDDWEAKQPGWNRTLDVLRHHLFELNREQQVSLVLLCGSDLLESFNIPGLWRDEDIDEILRDFGIIVISRDGNNPNETLNNSSKTPIFTKHRNNIHIVEDKIKNNVSSSYVRDSLSKGLSVRYLIDDSVLEYIQEKNLYGFTQ